MDLEWGDFKVLLALHRAGSMAGAARALRVDNSTVSRRLAALEDAVGAQLLIRGGREFIWTEQGRDVLVAAEATEAAIAAALRAVRASKAGVEGTVRVSVTPAFVPLLVQHLVPPLRRSHPGLTVQLVGAYKRANLAKGEADIALRMVRPEEPDLVARHALDCAWFVYASDGYLQAQGRPSSFDELPQHVLVLYAENLHSAVPTSWMESYKEGASIALRSDSLEIAYEAAKNGAGLVVLPAFVAEPALQRVFAEPVATNSGWIAYHESARDTSRVRVVCDALMAFAQEHRAQLMGLRP